MSEKTLPPEIKQEILDKVSELIESDRYRKIKRQLRDECSGRCYHGMILEAVTELGYGSWTQISSWTQTTDQAENGCVYGNVWDVSITPKAPKVLEELVENKYNTNLIRTRPIDGNNSALTLNDSTEMSLLDIHRLVLKKNKDA